MEKKTNKKAAMEAFLVLLDFHTKLFRNVLNNVTDEDAARRLDTPANHMAWIAGSLVQERFVLAKAMGIDTVIQTSDGLFSDHKGIQEGVTYPSLAEYRKDWDLVSPLLQDALASMDEAQLNGPDPFGMPGGDYTFYDAIVFCTDRESYCIGQLGLWRRLLGYEPMKYE